MRRRDRTTEVETDARKFHPWMPFAWVIGIASCVFGIWALVDTGVNTDHIYRPAESVLGMSQTPALALAEVAFGLLVLLSTVVPLVGRAMFAVLGAVALAAGVVIVADWWRSTANDFAHGDETLGWVYIGVGAVALLAALMLPTVQRRTVVRTVQPAESTVQPAESEAAPAAEPAPGETTAPRSARRHGGWWARRRHADRAGDGYPSRA
jgi:cytochrome b561